MKWQFVLLVSTFLIFISFVLLVTAKKDYGCLEDLEIKNIRDILNNLERINEEILSCDIKITGFIGKILGNGNIQALILMSDGTTEYFYVTISDKTFSSINEGRVSIITYSIETDEASIDYIINSENPVAAFTSLYKEGKITLTGGNFVSKVKVIIARIARRFFF